MALYPQYYWKIQFPSAPFEMFAQNGFHRQDKAELEYVEKAFAEEMREAFQPKPSDILYGKDESRRDVRIIVRGTEGFIWIFGI